MIQYYYYHYPSWVNPINPSEYPVSLLSGKWFFHSTFFTSSTSIRICHLSFFALHLPFSRAVSPMEPYFTTKDIIDCVLYCCRFHSMWLSRWSSRNPIPNPNQSWSTRRHTPIFLTGFPRFCTCLCYDSSNYTGVSQSNAEKLLSYRRSLCLSVTTHSFRKAKDTSPSKWQYDEAKWRKHRQSLI